MKKYIVTAEYENLRLDKWFRKNIQDLAQGLLEKSLRKGMVKLNGLKVASSVRLNINDIIEVSESLIINNIENLSKEIDPYYVEIVKKSIIFENQDILAINKRNNLAVQGGEKIKVSIDDILPLLDPNHQLRLVHRLDKNTTGILIIAKHHKSAQLLSQSFQNNTIRKKYLAILTSIPKAETGIIRNFIKKSLVEDKEKMVICEEREGVEAITKYKVLSRFSNGYCLIEFAPITGRTHQLRLHAQSLNCPILGDNKYGNKSKNDNKYLYLHAKSIDLSEVLDVKILEAALPDYFMAKLEILSH